MKRKKFSKEFKAKVAIEAIKGQWMAKAGLWIIYGRAVMAVAEI